MGEVQRIVPDGDLVYTIGESDYTKDWFFAQVTRYKLVDFSLYMKWLLSITVKYFAS